MSASTCLGSASRHVGTREFSRCLLAAAAPIWSSYKKQEANGTPNSLKVGVCVSGGPDSMALAYLLHSASNHSEPILPRFAIEAFIVDHGLRSESRDEAIDVHAMLESMEIPCNVLTIKWPAGVHPQRMRGLEEQARSRRYQIIAETSLGMGCSHLFTGHHRDDQTETLLMRLLQGNKRNVLGMRGMTASTTVPCCHNIFGARPWSVTAKTSVPSQLQSGAVFSWPENVQDGMHLHRPLLDFTKQQLVATCRHFRIPYVTDRTNADPSYATRNAVRLLRSHRIPTSLQSTRLAMTLQRATELALKIEVEARDFARTLSKLCMISQIGVFQFSIEHSISRTNMLGFRYFMARILSLVSPNDPENVPTLLSADAAECLGRAVSSQSHLHPEYLEQVVLGNLVLLRAVDEADPDGRYTRRKFLIRQPMRQSEIVQNHKQFDLDQSKLVSGVNQMYFSERILWDNRFWIQVSASEQELIARIEVRTFLKKDYARLEQSEKQTLNERLAEFIPRSLVANVRFTLPVLALRGSDTLIAFPSLDLPIGMCDILRWQVRYPRDKRVLDFFHVPTK